MREKHNDLGELYLRKETSELPWRAGRGKRLRMHELEIITDLEKLPVEEMSLDEIQAVGNAHQAASELAREIYKLTAWGW